MKQEKDREKYNQKTLDAMKEAKENSQRFEIPQL